MCVGPQLPYATPQWAPVLPIHVPRETQGPPAGPTPILGARPARAAPSQPSPQILRGASSSSRMGWLRKISRDFRHSPRISFSVSCTFFPGRDPWTGPTRETGVRDPASTSHTPRTLPASTLHAPHALPLRDRHWAWERWARGIQVPPKRGSWPAPKWVGMDHPLPQCTPLLPELGVVAGPPKPRGLQTPILPPPQCLPT